MAPFGNFGSGFTNVEFTFTMEPAAIKRMRSNIDCTSIEEDRDFLFACLSNRKVFDVLATDDDGNYLGLHNAIEEIFVENHGLDPSEIKEALADYDKILGIKPTKSETEIKIDKLQAELDQLRATLRKV